MESKYRERSCIITSTNLFIPKKIYFEIILQLIEHFQ